MTAPSPQPSAQSDRLQAEAREPATAASWEGIATLDDLSLTALLSMPIKGASRFKQSQTRAPSSVTVITQADMRDYGWRTVFDAITSLRGFYGQQDHATLYLGTRGVLVPGDYNSRILALVNVVRTNDSLYDQGHTGYLSSIGVQDIERIEVIRGASAAVYGTNAMFAVINVITKNGAGQRGVRGVVQAGTTDINDMRPLDYRFGGISYGDDFEFGLDVYASFYAGSHAGRHRWYLEEYDDPSTNNGISLDHDGQVWDRAFLRLSYGDLSLQVTRAHTDREIPNSQYFALYNERQHWDEVYTTAALTYESELSDDWSVLARATYHRYDYTGGNVYDYGAADAVTGE